MNGRLISPQLPLTTRARLHAIRRIDTIGAWLCGHRCTPVAKLLWKACRMW